MASASESLSEQLSFEFYERLDCDPAEPISPFTLARKKLGPGCIERGNFRASAITFRVNGARRIALRRGLAVEDAAFLVAHELGHIAFEEIGYDDEDLERQCDLFAGALMAPRPAMVRMYRAFGFDPAAIADEVAGTETWACLRLGETFGMPLAVIAQKVRVRGPESWEWPDEATLRGWGRRPPPGLAKARLTDDPSRVLLLADGTFDH